MNNSLIWIRNHAGTLESEGLGFKYIFQKMWLNPTDPVYSVIVVQIIFPDRRAIIYERRSTEDEAKNLCEIFHDQLLKIRKLGQSEITLKLPISPPQTPD